jgi:formylglycine-generating enzyme required for sulfatase activity
MKDALTVRWAVLAMAAVGGLWMAGCRHDPPEVAPAPPLVIDVPSSEFSFRLDDRATLTFLYVPPGSFRMGSSLVEVDRFPDEVAHDVAISEGFYLTETEITQAQWYAIMGTEPSYLSGANRPVEHVSWQAATEFCLKLSQTTGRICRLPTEAEWEYACRAGSTTAYSFGDDPADLGEHAWFQDNALPIKTHDVALRKPNAWGFYDMHGNVREWCSDVYDAYPDKTTWDPIGPSGEGNRVIRGGSWGYLTGLCRSAQRQHGPEDMSDEYVGLRVVMEVAP